MDIFLSDRKLNISPAYLRPGFAFGGSCLPKDLRGLVYAARRADVSVPILEHILPSNEDHLRRAFDAVAATGKRRVGLFGLSFKPGTDDLRESPLVELAERLLGKGYDLRIYDANVTLSRLMGANQEYIESRLPHLGDLLSNSISGVLEHAEVCVVGSTDSTVLDALEAAGDRTDHRPRPNSRLTYRSKSAGLLRSWLVAPERNALGSRCEPDTWRLDHRNQGR